ncbi:hypothetical protein NEOC95_000824, partial [Neochlamydia sp. AcF95]|nr:hypothetical protein [Neochlamydia sp. AcF95]
DRLKSIYQNYLKIIFWDRYNLRNLGYISLAREQGWQILQVAFRILPRLATCISTSIITFSKSIICSKLYLPTKRRFE